MIIAPPENEWTSLETNAVSKPHCPRRTSRWGRESPLATWGFKYEH